MNIDLVKAWTKPTIQVDEYIHLPKQTWLGKISFFSSKMRNIINWKT